MINTRLTVILSTATFLLLIPLVAMQFTTAVNWSWFDFAVAAVLLFGTGLLFDLAMRKLKSTNQRVLASLTILGLLVLVWLELAVGVFGTPLAGS